MLRCYTEMPLKPIHGPLAHVKKRQACTCFAALDASCSPQGHLKNSRSAAEQASCSGASSAKAHTAKHTWQEPVILNELHIYCLFP